MSECAVMLHSAGLCSHLLYRDVPPTGKWSLLVTHVCAFTEATKNKKRLPTCNHSSSSGPLWIHTTHPSSLLSVTGVLSNYYITFYPATNFGNWEEWWVGGACTLWGNHTIKLLLLALESSENISAGADKTHMCELTEDHLKNYGYR